MDYDSKKKIMDYVCSDSLWFKEKKKKGKRKTVSHKSDFKNDVVV